MRERPQTYAVTIIGASREPIFHAVANATVMMNTLFRYREQGRFLLHAFAVMPDHLHVIISPAKALEQAVGLIKGGASFALRKAWRGNVWQDSYYAHRVTNEADYDAQVQYVADNPSRWALKGYTYVHTHWLDHVDAKPPHLGG